MGIAFLLMDVGWWGVVSAIVVIYILSLGLGLVEYRIFGLEAYSDRVREKSAKRRTFNVALLIVLVLGGFVWLAVA